MTSSPWPGDAVALVDAYRAGDVTPLEVVTASLEAMEASDLNAFAHVDADGALAAAASADVTLPLGGVPIAVKELEAVAGWPHTQASLALADRVATADTTQVARVRAAGAVIVGLTTSPEFGASMWTDSRLHGVTRSPWDPSRTPGGSSGGSAAAVAGGLVPLASGTDGGGSLRMPAGYCGLVALKPTFGRIPRGPSAPIGLVHTVSGCVSRSVRDTARWLDITNGYDRRDPLSLPRVEGFEAGLGSRDLRGLRVGVAPDLCAAVVDPEAADRVRDMVAVLVDATGAVAVDLELHLPALGFEWTVAKRGPIMAALGDAWPECADQLGPVLAQLLKFSDDTYDLSMRAVVERQRTELDEAMAAGFDDVDVIVSATNPDIAFPAEGPVNEVAGRTVGPLNLTALTNPANIYGNPAITVPAGLVRGLPVGVQLQARHHEEALLLELAAVLERERPWPLVAPEVGT